MATSMGEGRTVMSGRRPFSSSPESAQPGDPSSRFPRLSRSMRGEGRDGEDGMGTIPGAILNKPAASPIGTRPSRSARGYSEWAGGPTEGEAADMPLEQLLARERAARRPNTRGGLLAPRPAPPAEPAAAAEPAAGKS